MLHPVALTGVLLISSLVPVHPDADRETPPQVGQIAPDFKLKTPEGTEVSLTNLRKEGPAVVIVLRGFPGYQCPLCSRQVGSLLKAAKELEAANAKVVFVYPGEAEGLSERANEFMRGTKLPTPFVLVTDPGYKFTNAYRLRWDAPRETAYPSTFVVGKDGKVTYAVVSKSHGGRTKTADVVAAAQKAQ